MFVSWTSCSSLMRYFILARTFYEGFTRPKVHHILAEIIQGGLVLETNVEEIDSSGLLHFSAIEYISHPGKKTTSTTIGQVTKGIICVGEPAFPRYRSGRRRHSRWKPQVSAWLVNKQNNRSQGNVIWVRRRNIIHLEYECY